MVGKILRASLVAAVLALGAAAQASAADDGQRLVMVYNDDPAQIKALESNYDVGFVGEKTEAGVYLDAQGEALLRAQGFRIGEVVADDANWEARKAEIAAAKAGEALSGYVARNGLTSAAKAKGAVNVPGEVVIQRAYTFSNYAGRFLYVEAHNALNGDTTGPTMSFTYTGPNGTSQVYSLSNFGTNPNSTNGITPDGGDAAIGGNKLRDTDANPGAQYMYHRGLVALRGADANLQASEVTVRVASSTGAFDTSGVTEWANKALPPRVASFQKDFITKYLDPVETYNRMDQLAAQYPSIMEAITLPNKTAGYERVAMAMLEGNTVQPNQNPSTSTTNPAAIASRARAVQVFSKALGRNGGNNITIELKAPAAGTLNAPLSVAVTDGTWRDVDPADTNAADGFSEVLTPTKDIVVNLATDGAGALTSTAKQVVDAINADPAASALVTAYTFAGNAGDGVVVPTPSRNNAIPAGTTGGTPTFASTKVRLQDGVRGGTIYWTGSLSGGTLARTDARHVTQGPQTMKVYRISSSARNTKVGVYIYCQQHAREWVTPITCVETAQRLVTNYAIDPQTKDYVDNLEIFILPSSNPDGGLASFHDNAAQRKNMKNYCTITESGGGAGAKFQWGVDLNRNNSIGTLFDGFSGASSSCTNDTFSGPSEVSEPEIQNEHWVVDNFPKIKFAINIHTHGGYFMWAPGAYVAQGRVTLPAPNIGIEKYFFEVADDILSHIKSARNTAILPQRTGPIADVLYSAAGNSADDQYYRSGIVAYSFEAGAQRLAVNPTTGGITRTSVGFQPCFQNAQPPAGFASTPCTTGTPPVPNPELANEGHDSTMEFAEGNYGLLHGALEYTRDTTPPQTTIEYSAQQTSGDPINYRFNWVGEPSVIYYTTDGTTPTIVDCNNPTGSTRCYNNQGPRRPGEILTLGLGAHTIKWMSVDIKGNQEAVHSQRLLVAADDADGNVGGTVPPTLALSLGAPGSFGAFTPGIDKDYTASTTANVISTAGDATLSVSDPATTNTGKLVNGPFALAQPVQASASSMGGTGLAFAPVGGSANPTTILTYNAPKSNDSVTVNFKQTIGKNEGLRTGTYSKTLTFTLSTTTP